MMKIETKYVCEICGTRFGTEDAARACEAQGVPTPLPVGLIIADNRPDAFYSGIVYAVAESWVNDHYNGFSVWACRDTKKGDSLGTQRCSGDGLHALAARPHLNPALPAYARMVAYLRGNGIEPTIMCDGRLCPAPEPVIRTGQ